MVQHLKMAAIQVMVEGSFSGPAMPSGQYTVSVVNDRGEQLVEQMTQVTPGCSPLTLRLPEESGSRPSTGSVSMSRLAHRVQPRPVKEFRRSQRAARSGDTAALFEHLKEAVAADPDFFEARINLGAAYMDRNDPREASRQFSDAVRLDPSSVLAWTDFAVSQLNAGESDRAEDSARHAVQLDPTSVQANYALALSWVALQRFDQPILHHLQPAFSHYPHAHIVAAQALAGMGKLDEARTHVRTYLDSGNVPDRPKVEAYLRQLNRP